MQVTDAPPKTKHMPKTVATALAAFERAADERNHARQAWQDAKDAAEYEEATLAGRAAQAIRDGKPRPRNRIEELQAKSRALAVDSDATAKVAAELERELADAIVAQSKEWVAGLDEEAESRKTTVRGLLAGLLVELDAIDELHSAKRAIADTRPSILAKYRLRRATTKPREGLRELAKWLDPPKPVQPKVRARNFGSHMSRDAIDFISREDLS